jgi:hypothetical protein
VLFRSAHYLKNKSIECDVNYIDSEILDFVLVDGELNKIILKNLLPFMNKIFLEAQFSNFNIDIEIKINSYEIPGIFNNLKLRIQNYYLIMYYIILLLFFLVS